MDPHLLKFLAGVAALAAEHLDAAARPPATETPPTAPPSGPGPTTPEDPLAGPDVEEPRCSLCAAAGEALVAGPCGAACGRCLANAMPLVIDHLRHSANALSVQNGLYEAALADLDRRTRELHEQVEQVLRDAEVLKAERDRLLAERDFDREVRARAGATRVVVVSEHTCARVELCVDEAMAGRFLRFCARAFPGAAITVDDQPQDVEYLAHQARLEFWRESVEDVYQWVDTLGGASVEEAEAAGQVSAVGDDADAAGGVGVPQQPRWQGGATGDPGAAAPWNTSVSSTALLSTTPASIGSSPALRCEAADSEIEGLTALLAHVHDEQARPRAPLGQYTPPYHPPKSRRAAATGRKRISAWLDALHARGLELASGLHTAEDIARRLNPGREAAAKAGVSPPTLAKFKAEPGGRSVETLARLAVAMGRSELLALRYREHEGTAALDVGWAGPTMHTIN